jgi:hypothetical protein
LPPLQANEVRLLLGVIAYNLGNLLRRTVLPVAIQRWALTSVQQRLFKDRRAPDPACAVLCPPACGESLDRDPLLADPRAHRAARLASDVTTFPRAATGRWIIAGSGVSESAVTSGNVCGNVGVAALAWRTRPV